MTQFAIIDPLGNISRLPDPGTFDPTGIQIKAGWRVLPVIDTDPPFDATTQVKSGPILTVNANDVSRVWTVRAKTAGELDGDKDLALSAMDMAVFKILFNHENRVRVLEGKVPVTAVQFRAAVKALL